MTIRTEVPQDYHTTEQVVQAAFAGQPFSDQTEHLLVKRLRESAEFVPALSLVFEENGRIVGHLLLSKIKIEHDGGSFDEALALAPVSVLPSHQGKGIGAALINHSINAARALGYKALVVLGHERYYPKFGFRPASHWGIRAPFEIPDELFMALELAPGSLDGVHGTVRYSPAFSG
ncbi:N-acetyltransferase [Brevibacillus agri]|uniref:GNAT family N-acetyltransferase n=1 Tax=Brevibacillus agri TaxID=51101 RepID=UPI002E1DDF29|nr:N-acetyltransferase [Brevibacillus agri]MED1653296.1 N-acetyltransferase [Brevibacillus agri]MED1687133.1 N-acetyltransferase [Brevibacillus agri]MED1690882.1 N-acetyltransferase [Brevibacillus agri]MED1699850.1 N-acetyltransferase [Brevibacillus agri]